MHTRHVSRIAVATLLLWSGLLIGGTGVAQHARPILIGALNASWGPTPQVVGLRERLLELGYRENEDFVIGVRFTQGDLTALAAAARQLVQDGVDILLVDHDDAAKAARIEFVINLKVVHALGLTLAPGGHVGDHNHLGPGIRQMTVGEMEYILPDKTIIYRAGDFFFETGDVSHRVNNKTSERNTHLLFEILPMDLKGASLIVPRDKAGQ